jgi:hypothetical protein
MKKSMLLILPFLVSSQLMICAGNREQPSDPAINAAIGESSGEDIFLKNAEHCLLVMEEAAKGMTVQGVAVIAFIPGEASTTWLSEMMVVGALSNGSANYLAVAYSKAAEMAETYKDSGSGVREPMHGEFGYQGGLIQKVRSGYLVTVFSGATGEQDTEIARAGMEILAGYFE